MNKVTLFYPFKTCPFVNQKMASVPSVSLPSIELVMIVKNAGEVLRKVLRAAKPILQRYTILDTGSIDHTIALIREEMQGVEGNVYEEPFVDFSTSRNRAFELASGECTFYLVLDDSYELHGGPDLVQHLASTTADTCSLRIGTLHHAVLESYYYNVRLTRCRPREGNATMADRVAWRYVGKVHEHIPDPHTEYITADTIFINDLTDNDHLVRSRMRFRRDLPLLLEEHLSQPENPRTLMYLCKTYILVKEFAEALRWFDKMQAVCTSHPTIHEEYQFFAWYEKACLQYGEIDHNAETFKKELLSLTKRFRHRVEPFYKLSTFMYEAGEYRVMKKLLDKLIHFPKPELYLTTQETLIYDYYLPYLYVDVHLKLGEFDLAIPKLRKMLDLYPYDQPLLNIKYAVMDKSGLSIQPLAPVGKTLVIHTGAIDWCWDPKSNTKISGSEVMAIRMAKSMVKLGYRVFLFGSFLDDDQSLDYQGVDDGVQYIDYSYFTEFSMKYVIDHLVVSRFLSHLVYYDNILNVYLWVHDILPQVEKNSPLFQTHPVKFRGMIVLSTWHSTYVQQRVGIPPSLTWVSRNAIDATRFVDDGQVTRQPFRFIYTSDAFRGLGHLLEMLPSIYERYPALELYVFTRLEHVTDAWNKRVKEMPYVKMHPRVSQEQLAIEWRRSDVWLYPTDFEETYCISALEAMAAGCLVATTRLAGLIDTVGDRGVTVEPPITHEAVREELVKKLCFVLDRPEVKTRYVEKAREWALRQTYDTLAVEWHRWFSS